MHVSSVRSLQPQSRPWAVSVPRSTHPIIRYARQTSRPFLSPRGTAPATSDGRPHDAREGETAKGV